MGAWIKAGVETEAQIKNENASGFGTRTPIVGQRYSDAYDAAKGNLGADGLNATQRTALGRTSTYLDNGGAAARVGPANTDLTNIRTGMDRFSTQGPHMLGGAPRATAGTATAGTATASMVDPVGDITAERVNATRGADFRDAYLDPYMNEVVDASLADYDVGAAEARTALRAGNAGAFGNKRYGVAEGQFGADSSRDRALLGAGLRSDAFRFSTDSGMKDSDRRLTGDMANQDASLRAATSNAGNLLSARTSNANNLTSTSGINANNQTSTSVANANNQTSASTTNANIQNTRDISDQNSLNTNDRLAFDALTQQAGITETIANNIIKADGIDLEAAQSEFLAGTISQEQLSQILDMADEWNGSSYTDNSRTNSNSLSVNASAGFGL